MAKVLRKKKAAAPKKTTKTRRTKKAAPKTGGWFQRGQAGIEHAEKEQQLRDEEAARRVLKFHLKPGQSGKLIFLDGAPNDPFLVLQHSMYPQRQGPYTCPSEFTECPLCDVGKSKSRVCALTVIDLRKYTSEKTGKTFKATKKLLAMPNKARKKFFKRVEKIPKLQGDVTYTMWEFSRDDADECGVGETFEFQSKRLSRATLLKKAAEWAPPGVTPEEFIEPINYMEVFEPLATEQLRIIAGGGAVIGTEVDDDYEDEDFDVDEQDDLEVEEEEEEEDEFEEEEEEEEEEEDEEEEEEEPLDLSAMKHAELVELCAENTIKVPVRLKKRSAKNAAALRELIATQLDEGEEDGEEFDTDEDLEDLVEDE